jgi:hypothetical protein
MYRFALCLVLANLAAGFCTTALAEEPGRTPDGEPMKHHSGVASLPGDIPISMPKLIRLEPLLAPPETKKGEQPAADKKQIPEPTRLRVLEVLREHMAAGSSNAAVVISVKPLLVAAYTGDLDCIAMLAFPDWLVKEYNLQVGSRLLTVNTFHTPEHRKDAPDLHFGPKRLPKFTNVFPIIADFVTYDKERVAEREKEIGDEAWERCEKYGKEYREKYLDLARNGSPLYSGVPAAAKSYNSFGR